MSDLHYISAANALAKFTSKELSPVELLSALIARAEKVEPEINAFAESRFDEAMDAEKAAEAVVAKARAKADTLMGEARREVEALQIRREEIKAEMSRVQGVLDALAGPIVKPTPPASAGAKSTGDSGR